eukprot:11035591-Alexandrium_andersonii.AAC.1
MSASLVGSEMCIRDRPRPPRGWPPLMPRTTDPQRGRIAGKPASAGPRSFSYTHLTLPTICSV